MAYDVTYTIDAYGHRVTPDPVVSAAPAMLFFGCSFTFGEGVADEEALPYQVAVLTGGRYRVVNLGFHGYGPHQMLAAIENDLVEPALRGSVPQYVFYQYIDGHERRAAGLSRWDKHGPAYSRVGRSFKVVYRGPFTSDADLRTFSAWLRTQVMETSALGRRVLSGERPTTTRDADLLTAIVCTTRDQACAKWPGVRFVVLFWDEGPPYRAGYVPDFKPRVLKYGLYLGSLGRRSLCPRDTGFPAMDIPTRPVTGYLLSIWLAR